MNTWIALFRGINVGGNHMLPMKDLVAQLADLGCQDVKTYIQSGNAVFQCSVAKASTLSGRIAAAVEERRGFRPRVLVMKAADLESAVAANPFPEAEAEPKSLHLWFLADRPSRPDLASLKACKAANERYVLKGGVFYLHAPDGIGRSKLAERVERTLGVEATARNWRSVCKILELARALG